MLYFPCYVLLCHAHILEGLYDLISVESNRLLGIRIDSNRLHQNFSPHGLRIYSRVPLNGLPVSRKSLILELTRIVFALRRFDSVWVYCTWVPGPGVICGLFIVGSRPCSEGFLPVLQFFLPPQKPTFSNSNSIWNPRGTGLSVEDCSVSPSLNKVDLC